ncbi:DUF2520 domain-containing protein [Hymenobacter sp. BT175]|uniref:Rossmann-like and DUF2520 domain-containing protein n=1 Tax=Hymenobacter translucens TaxID=2886507 RepID=UPI001D0E0A92|nr:Rossmann-like and DUF2520 domain-containing protein [Hymenobacter translucens]MCC2547506.1 DUF2520 domain-containing protein [Hymenobacter translucens]
MPKAKGASMQIGLLGAGRVGAQLGPALVAAGHRVVAVWSRTPGPAAALAARLPGARSTTVLAELPPADLYLLAVPDAAIGDVLQALHLPAGSLVAHTSGSVPLAVFHAFPGLRGGIFYPLQTFSPGRDLDWARVPLCIEATDESGEATLLAVARTLSDQAELVATPQRQVLHVAAVFASNFTNHLLGISRALLKEAQLPFGLLGPLVEETVAKALTNPPFEVQTGPAARRDEPTLVRHRAALAAYPQWQELYSALTASIQQQLPAAPGPPDASRML